MLPTGSAGKTSHENSGSGPGWLAGGGCSAGPTPECSTPCIRSCPPGRPRRTGLTSHARRWTAVTSTPKGAGTGPSPVNRGKPGNKHHLICDGDAPPIYVVTGGANVPDLSRALFPLVVTRRPPAGRPRRRFATPPADRAHSSQASASLPRTQYPTDRPEVGDAGDRGPRQAALRHRADHHPTCTSFVASRPAGRTASTSITPRLTYAPIRWRPGAHTTTSMPPRPT